MQKTISNNNQKKIQIYMTYAFAYVSVMYVWIFFFIYNHKGEVMSDIISTNKEIADFFSNVAKCDISRFLAGFELLSGMRTDLIDYSHMDTDIGERVFLATIKIPHDIRIHDDEIILTIEKLNDTFIIQPLKDDVLDNESITIHDVSFLGRRCAIIMTIAQCRYCDYQLINDIENKKKEICYL